MIYTFLCPSGVKSLFHEQTLALVAWGLVLHRVKCHVKIQTQLNEDLLFNFAVLLSPPPLLPTMVLPKWTPVEDKLLAEAVAKPREHR